MTSLEVSSVLRDALKKKKQENARFSMRSLASKLSISVPYLSQIMSGQRAVPTAIAESLCRMLDLDNEKRDFVLRTVLKGRGVGERKGLLRELNESPRLSSLPWTPQPSTNFWVLEQWHYLALLDATLLEDYDGTPEFLADRLSLDLTTVAEAVGRLQVHGFLIENENSLWVKANRYNDFASVQARPKIQEYHQQSLAKAAEALKKKSAEDIEKRLISTYTMTASAEDIQWAKQKIVDLMQELMAKLSQNTPAEVYQLSVQFFPLTEPKEKADPLAELSVKA